MVKNLKKPDLVARQKPPFYTTLIGNKIADRITKSTRNKKQKEDDRIIEETQELIIPPEKREQIIRDLKLF